MADFNLLVDPGLGSADWAAFSFGGGGTVTRDGDTFVFDSAGALQGFSCGSSTDMADFIRDYIAKGGQYKIMVHVTAYDSDTVKARLRNGNLTNLNVSATGWTDPVLIIPGTSNTAAPLIVFGNSGSTLTIGPAESGDYEGQSVRIFTA